MNFKASRTTIDDGLSTKFAIIKAFHSLIVQLGTLRKQYAKIKPTNAFINEKATDKFYSLFSPQVIADIDPIVKGRDMNYKNPVDFSLLVLTRTLFTKSLGRKRKDYDEKIDLFRSILEENLPKGTFSISHATKMLGDGSLKIRKRVLKTLLQVFKVYEEILMDFKSHTFLNLAENTKEVIRGIVGQGSRLVEVKSPEEITEYQLSKKNLTSSTKFMDMMSKTVHMYRPRPTMNSLLKDAKREGTAIKMEQGNLLEFNESLNVIFSRFQDQF